MAEGKHRPKWAIIWCYTNMDVPVHRLGFSTTRCRDNALATRIGICCYAVQGDTEALLGLCCSWVKLKQ